VNGQDKSIAAPWTSDRYEQPCGRRQALRTVAVEYSSRVSEYGGMVWLLAVPTVLIAMVVARLVKLSQQRVEVAVGALGVPAVGSPPEPLEMMPHRRSR
jgi:hypothetical protein